MRIFRVVIHVSLLVAAMIGMASIARAEILGFGDFSNFTITQGDGGSAALLFPAPGIASSIQLTTPEAQEDRDIFYDIRQNISQPFMASFTYKVVGSGDNFNGASFIIQNSAAGANAVGSQRSFGLGGISDSVGVTLQLSSPTSTGEFTNGNVGNGASPTTLINLASGDAIDVLLVSSGSTLSETLTDEITHQTFSQLFPVNIASVIGSSTAYIGFGAAIAGSGDDDQFLSNFQFRNTPEPSSFLLLGCGVAALFAGRRLSSLRSFRSSGR